MTELDIDPTGRSFALLDDAVRERLGAVLRPLAWIDGLVTAELIAPDDESSELDAASIDAALAWLGHIWNGEVDIDKLSSDQVEETTALAMDHYLHVGNQLEEAPEAYAPYLAGAADPAEAAAQWAAGFCSGLSLNHEAWQRLLADEDAVRLVIAIFSLVRDEDMPEEIRADSVLSEMPAEARAQLRGEALAMLPELVISLHGLAHGYVDDDDLDDTDDDGDGSEDPTEPRGRRAPKPQ